MSKACSKCGRSATRVHGGLTYQHDADGLICREYQLADLRRQVAQLQAENERLKRDVDMFQELAKAAKEPKT